MFDPYNFEPVAARGKKEKLEVEFCWYEAKLDGCRQVLSKIGDEVFLTGRRRSVKTGLMLNKIGWVPHLKKLANKIPFNFMLDGELISTSNMSSNYTTSIMGSKVGRALDIQKNDRPLTFFVFDCIMYKDDDKRLLQYHDRRRLYNAILKLMSLKSSVDILPFIRPVPIIGSNMRDNYHYVSLEYAFDTALAQGYEGLIIKNNQGTYHKNNWAKIKNIMSIDYVIVGYNLSDSFTYKNKGIASLVLGLYKNGELITVCKCSGMSESWRYSFYEDYVKVQKGEKSRYIGNVVEVYGQELFSTGALRHPYFKLLRPDLNAKDQTFEKYGILEEG